MATLAPLVRRSLNEGDEEGRAELFVAASLDWAARDPVFPTGLDRSWRPRRYRVSCLRIRRPATSSQPVSAAFPVTLVTTKTAKSLAGAIQVTQNQKVFEPPWVSAGPPAQGWSSATIHPKA